MLSRTRCQFRSKHLRHSWSRDQEVAELTRELSRITTLEKKLEAEQADKTALSMENKKVRADLANLQGTSYIQLQATCVIFSFCHLQCHQFTINASGKLLAPLLQFLESHMLEASHLWWSITNASSCEIGIVVQVAIGSVVVSLTPLHRLV